MHKVSKDRRGRLTRAALVAVGGISTLMVAGPASAGVINVAAANAIGFTTNNADNSTFGTGNQHITPVNYTPAIVDVPLSGHPSDAADPDTGTKWNSLHGVNTNLAVNVTATTYIQYEQNLSLVDSGGNATGVTLNVYARLPNGKGDAFHSGSNALAGAGTDGLAPSPLAVPPIGSVANDGWVTSSNNNLLMGSEWIGGGTGEGWAFTFNGLQPNTAYSLYVYGAGNTNGQGGRFEGTTTLVTDATTGITTGGVLNATAVNTNNVAANSNRSVFDSTNSPAGEQGLSWDKLSLTSDANGQLSFAEDRSSLVGGIKPALNGFQLDGPLVAGTTPEPTTALLFGVGSVGFLLKRRPKK